MGQRATTTSTGLARATRSYRRKLNRETVRRAGRSESFRRRWREPNVIYVMADPDAWSAYLRRMTRRPDWSVARLARESGIARSRIFSWIAEGAESITIRSVYAIADALGVDRAEALAAAGNLPPERDVEVDLILSSNRSENQKAALIERLMRRREEERARRLADLEFVLEEDGPDAEAS